MKPIQLAMTAFGPYKETETIDFRELKDHRLFVVSGTTGAGKTTIFDAICFALYGQASGEDRTDIRALRSQFADDQVQSTVDLLFEIHNRTFRVIRQIPYTKQGNKSETPGRCELYEVVDGRQVPFVERQIVTEVNKKVEELIGFTQAQFSQIVMLPQGEFRKFLTSDTENKEAIMRKIFKTEPYRKMVDLLKKKKDDAFSRYTAEKQLGDTLVSQLSAKLPPRESLLFDMLQEDYVHTARIAKGLEEEITYYSSLTETKRTEYETAYARHMTEQKRLHDAQAINERFAELQQKELQLETLSLREEEMKLAEQELLLADRAAQLESFEQQAKSLESELETKECSYKEAVQAVQLAEEQFATAEAVYTKELERDQERTAVMEELMQLESLVPTVTGLAEQRETITKLQRAIALAEANCLKSVQEEAAKQEEIQLQKEKIARSEEKLEVYEELIDSLAQLSAATDKVRSFNETAENFHQINRQFEQSAAEYEKARIVFERLEQQWIEHQAVQLAATLEDGDSCPVCGSDHHPAKANTAGDQEVSKQEIEEAKRELAAKEQQFYRDKAGSEHLRQTLDVLNTELKQQELHVDRDYEEEHKQVQQKVEALRTERSELRQKKDVLKRLEGQLEEVLHFRKGTEKELGEKQNALTNVRARYEAALQTVPENLHDVKVLSEQIAQKKKKQDELNQLWKEAQKQRQEASDQYLQAKSVEKHSNEALLEVKEKCMSAKQLFLSKLDEAGFQTSAEYSKAKRSAQTREELRRQLSDYARQLYSLQSSVDELRTQLEGREKTEVAALEQRVAELKKLYEESLTEYNNLLACKDAAEDVYHRLSEHQQRLEEVERIHGKVENLYDVLRGDNRLKLSFERFIQIEYLERIISSANERLREMSNGQYELIHSDRQEARGRQSGLGIDVHDAYTGQTRDVKTLSGGEKFNASLCLALGMADVIQSFQGAVRIDTMFIDEGFGALDEEALQKAIETLIALQQSGRMVGVISHVEELKSAIPAILQVTKLKEGYSRTKFTFN